MSYLDLLNQVFIKKFPTNFFLRVYKKASHVFGNAGRFCLYLFVSVYRTIGTTYLGGACRFSPSCSEYALELIQNRAPFFQCLFLISKRIFMCRPFGRYGYHPIPNHLRCHCGE